MIFQSAQDGYRGYAKETENAFWRPQISVLASLNRRNFRTEIGLLFRMIVDLVGSAVDLQSSASPLPRGVTTLHDRIVGGHLE